MSGTQKQNPYAVTLDEPEKAVHVPVEDQATEQPGGPIDPDAGGDEDRRQLRLVGGA